MLYYDVLMLKFSCRTYKKKRIFIFRVLFLIYLALIV